MNINLVHTIIDSSTYNLDINNSCTVTVTLLDYNNNPISNRSTTITCTDGTLNDSSSSYTASTDNNGQIQVTYKAENWGLHYLECNNESIGIWIIGKKTFKTSASAYQIQYSRNAAELQVQGASLAGTNGNPTTITNVSKDDIRPGTRAVTSVTAGFITAAAVDGNGELMFNSDGNIQWRCNGASSNNSNSAYGGVCYARKTPNKG